MGGYSHAVDFTGYSAGKKYSDGANGKGYDAKRGNWKLELMGGLMSRSTLANIEAGRRNIKASDLKALKILFDVDYEEFFKDWISGF